MKTVKLTDSLEIPIIGFGTWQLSGDEAYQSVKTALEAGYRHIDTADGYGNHHEVGRALKDSGIQRSEIFLTTKVRHSDLAPETIKDNVSRFLEELRIDYIDLLLIHWPNKDIPMSETLKAFDAVKEEGLIKSIGVSNFTERHIEEALEAGVEIVNNQIEIHPSFAQFDLVEFCQSKGISVTAYSPIARGADLEIPEIKQLAEKYDVSAANIILAWLMSRNIIVIPKSTNSERIADNLKSQELELEPEDIEIMNSLNQDNRLVNPSHSEFD